MRMPRTPAPPPPRHTHTHTARVQSIPAKVNYNEDGLFRFADGGSHGVGKKKKWVAAGCVCLLTPVLLVCAPSCAHACASGA